MAVTKVTDEDFSLQINSNENVIVKFYADWCGTCRLLSPKYNRMSDEDRFEEITFLDINAEDNPQSRQAAKVESLPYFAVYKGGKLLEGMATSREEKIEEMLQKLN